MAANDALRTRLAPYFGDDTWGMTQFLYWLRGRDPKSAFLDPEGGHLKVDGHLTSEPGLAALVLVADCLPVALAGDGAVAMVHCGWRGLAGGIVARGVAALREAGARGPVTALLGPAARGCCYEVGEEVHAHFEAYGARVGERNLDLATVARAQLEAAGVDEVHDVGMCAMCWFGLFFSHRRDGGVTGRQAGVVWRA